MLRQALLLRRREGSLNVRLRVCIEARVHPESGGLVQFIQGLASGLASLENGDDEYIFLVEDPHVELFTPFVAGPARLEVVPALGSARARVSGLGTRFARPIFHYVSPVFGPRTVSIPSSPGHVERLAADVVHFQAGLAYTTTIPSVFQPWDLQYRHFPQFFPRRTRLVRELRDRVFCDRASRVIVASEFGRDDLVSQLGIEREKIAVVPIAPATDTHREANENDVARVRRMFDLPSAFLLYPAQTWPHKNHLGLVEATALLRKSGLDIPLVCTGRHTDFFLTISAHSRRLGVTDLVRFTGFVEPRELKALYRLCRGVVFPTFFEGGGMPALEAFASDAALACSNCASLPEMVGDAAILFDPTSPADIARAVRIIWCEPDVRATLIRRGRLRLRSMSWESTARATRTLYRAVAADRQVGEWRGENANVKNDRRVRTHAR
jgi:glycosyltransferase involved in cell wall biosynthesis